MNPNFSNDENIIFSLILAKDVLLNKLTELTGESYQEIDDSLAEFTGVSSAKFSDDEIKLIINKYRCGHKVGSYLAKLEMDLDSKNSKKIKITEKT